MCCLQVPIYEMRNDGRDNLLGALLIAGQFVIPEVCPMHATHLNDISRLEKCTLAASKKESQELLYL